MILEKGGDQIYDIYSFKKYNGEGDRNHPKYCKQAILNQIICILVN